MLSYFNVSYKLLILCGCFVVGRCDSNPWGKDADLANQKRESCASFSRPSFITKVGQRVIRFHQEVISPADGPRSHFIPSSSQYTFDAMQKYGFFQGYAMGCDRLMRENDDPWVYRTTRDGAGHLMKWDPVL
jgi:putative component of membrane protein insertase Oxa1/YidC/SpoIIIJ protein YidD